MNAGLGATITVHLPSDCRFEYDEHGSACWLSVEDEDRVVRLVLFGSADNAQQLAKGATAWAEALAARAPSSADLTERGEAA